jgi:hypothetical protein
MRRPGARRPVAAPRQQRHQTKSFPAPTSGWVSNRNLAMPVPMSAVVLENFFPNADTVRVRGGTQKHATVGTDPCESLMVYKGGSVERLFGSCDGEVFHISSPADADTPPAAEFSGQTADYYSYQNFPTSGGNFMYIVNGIDAPRLYDGTTWSAITDVSVPIAITGTSAASFIHVNAYRNRLFFVQADSLHVWALPVNQVGGAAIDIDLAGVFKHSKTVIFTATQSADSGDGMDDRFVIVTDDGEVAIYEGANPADANDWRLVGRYDTSPPLGRNAHINMGGDLVIATQQGLMPLSVVQRLTPAEQAASALSINIEPDWTRDALARRSIPWEMLKWTQRAMLIVTNPVTSEESTTPPQCYVANTNKGAWAKYTGWNTRCLALFQQFAYFGTNDGTVYQAEITGSDDGEIYVSRCAMAFDHLGSVGAYKTVVQAKGVFRAKTEFEPQLSASSDYAVEFPAPPNAVATSGTSGEWDVALWDVALWDTGSQYFHSTTQWVSIGVSGEIIAPQVQISNGDDITPTAELTILHLTHVGGEVVV